MKRTVSILLLIILCVPLCACGNANAPAANAPTSTPQPTVEAAASAPAAEEQPAQNITIVNFATPTAKEEADITFDEPVTILDNEFAKITITGKYAGLDDTSVNQVYGYKAIVENKTDNMYLMITIPQNISIDGFMLDHQAGFFATLDRYAPGSKANTRFYILLDRVQSLELNSIDDLKNVNGNVQIMYSNDGNTYTMSPDGSFPPNNSFQFINIIP